ncbi:MAG: prolyl oligopeptidase family serine peptidase, partial [Actinomycetota bacterium]|nr:prolyl oligopeptidase family serine peptidase [Actinomycetota bacterium]
MLSPDGRWLAYVRMRPRHTATFHKYDLLSGGDRCDVWIVDAAGGAPQNLTRGADDGSGHWAPSWSGDSKRLALLSTRGANVRAWVCDIASKTLHQLSARGVEPRSHAAPMLWVSNDEILLATLPEGERPGQMTDEIRAAEVAMREWPKAWTGLQPTASALDSGTAQPFGDRPQGALVLVDATTGVERTVMRGLFRDLRIAPDGRHVAFFRQVDVRRPLSDGKLDRPGALVSRLGIVTSDGQLLADSVQEIEQPVGGSLRWSPDSAEVALLGHVDAAAGTSKLIFRYRLADARLRRETETSLEPTSLVWTGDNSILTFAQPAQGSGAARADWWLVASGEEPRKLSADLDAVPTRLFAEDGRRSFVGLGTEGVLRLSLTDGSWTNLTDGVEGRISAILWPPAGDSDRRTIARLVLTVDDENSADRFSLDLQSGAMTFLRWPRDGAWLLDFAPALDTAVHGAFDRAGAGLWLSRPAFAQHRAIVETNTWLREVAEGEIRRVDYRGLSGGELTGWVILPVDHEPGRCHPLITAVYPGLVFRGHARPTTLSIAGNYINNPQLLAARGYAVLIPSMPLSPEGEPGDPSLDVVNGVLPAVDAAIEMGIADPDRLGLMGHSYGGYGTYALITQTHRFRTAVALAGIADLVSLYGQFDARLRYDAHPHEYLLIGLAETGQLRMGAPPWQDAERYVRNSPLFAAGDVQTPL